MAFVKTEVQGAVEIIAIDRPKALNALNPEVLADLKAAFEAVDQEAIRCIVLTGEGDKSFVAGADIGSMSTMTKAEGEAFGKLGNDVFLMIEHFPIPVIAAVNGFALGGGNELAMSCDIRICSDNAVFGQPEVGLGITPGFGGTQRLARLVGMGMAKQLVYSALNIKADEALRIGLVNAVYPQAELMENVLKLAGKIAKNAPIAVRNCKKAINGGISLPIEKAVEVEEKLFGSCFETPSVKDSSEVYGYTNIQGVDVPVAGIAGDQQAALFGQGCFKPGDVKNTYGTGCFLLMNTGNKIYQSKNGLVTTIAISLDGEVEYALEGSVFVGGAVIQWIRDGMHLIQDSCDSEYYAQKVPDNGGVYIVPAFTGLGAPYWDMYARGAILGITRGTTQNHIIRAAEESIAYQSADLMWAMEKDTDITISTLKVDGGASRDHFLMQFQSDILNKEVLRPAIRETTALGAAYLAGLATGVWKSREEISHLWSCNQLFEPKMDAAQREKLVKGWHKAVGRSQNWAEHEV